METKYATGIKWKSADRNAPDRATCASASNNEHTAKIEGLKIVRRAVPQRIVVRVAANQRDSGAWLQEV